MPPPKRKVAMIGIDAAEITYIRDNLEHFPNFCRLLNSSVNIDVHSDAQFLPGSIWPSFFTEKTPGEHGFYLIMGWDPAQMRLRRVTAERLPLRPFWRDLSDTGLKVIAVDVPMCHGPHSGGSIEIVGWGTHQDLSSFSVHPPDLRADLQRRFGQSSMGDEIPIEDRAGRGAHAARVRMQRCLIESSKRKAELIKWLVTTRDWDFLLAILGEAHRAGHVLWPSENERDPELLCDVYRAVDSSLGEIISCVRTQGSQVGVFALHGMGSNNSQRHFAPEIVRRFNRHWSGMAPEISRRSLGSYSSFIRLVRARVPRQFTTRLANTLSHDWKDALTNYLYAGGTDWSKTPAIVLKSDGNGYIRLNLIGREEQGILHRDGIDTCKYLTELKECLTSFESRFNQPLVDQVRSISEIAHGGKIDLLPDLVITWAPQPQLIHTIKSPVFGEISAAPDDWRGGYHRDRGFLLLDASAAERNYPAHIDVTSLASLMRDALFTEISL